MCDNQAERDMDFLSYVREEIADGARDKFFTVEFVADIMEALDRVIAERNEMQRELRKAETECSMLRVECGVLEKNAETTYGNHKRIVAELTAERDKAWLKIGSIRNEIDCRIQHGADSNGHLEAILKMIDKDE